MPLSPLLPADVLAANFTDLKPPLRPQEALVEASRCLYCFDAPCIMACPTGIDVPAFIKKIAFGNPAGAAKTILTANILFFVSGDLAGSRIKGVNPPLQICGYYT